jgi:hypothetical protein
MSDVGFTGAQLTILGLVFGPLLSAIGVLFGTTMAAKNAHLATVEKALEDELAANKELAAAVKEATTELRELRQDLWRERRVGDWRERPT